MTAVICALSTFACHKPNIEQKANNDTAPGTAPPVVSPTPTISDPDVRNAVTTEFRRDKRIDESKIDIGVTHGIVALTGKMDNLLSKARAIRIAESVRGVRSVADHIAISPQSRPDHDIESDVGKALSYDATTAKMPVHAVAKGGVVTLTGVVGSWQELQLAERIADGVRGVRSVQNDLSTKSSAKRDDSAIAADVKGRLAWDALVEHDPIGFSVTNSRVFLSGTVGSAAERSRAISDAWVDGVESVDPTGLEVKWWDRPDKNLALGTPKSDHDVAAAIKDAVRYDSRVKSFNIYPSVANGVAVLTGTVDTVKGKMAAEMLARNTVGVTQVKNQLEVRSPQQISDHLLADRITEFLDFDPVTEGKDIHVSVKNGKVELTGTVSSYLASAEAFDVASTVGGVNLIADELEVREPAFPYVYSSYLDPYVPYVETWYIVGPKPVAPDGELETRIRAELDWSPFMEPNEVHVRVKDGRATLTGLVPTNRLRQVATDDALEAGAIAVDNELAIG